MSRILRSRLAAALVLLTPPLAFAVDEAPLPATAPSGVRGQVVDARTGEPLIEAGVKLVLGDGQGPEVRTDVDGRFELPLSPGTHELRAFYELYQGRRIQNVQVTAAKWTTLTVALQSDEEAIQVVEVEARADRRTETALLSERKKAATVTDAISAQEMSRTPDSSAGDAVKRVVSATVVDGKYLLLRGLGGRYSQTLVNGAVLPSPEPDEPSVPLDLFPSSLLANLSVTKSYGAHLPGTFGGGTLSLETNTYPSEFELRPRLSLSGNTLTTFQSRLGPSGGSESLPARVPEDGPAYRLSDAELADIGRSFENAWSPRASKALPNLGLGVSVGDTVDAGGRRAGYLAQVGYARAEQVRTLQVGDVRRGLGDTLDYKEQGTVTSGNLTSQLGGLLNLGLELGQDDELSALALYTRGSERQSQLIRGFDQNNAEDFEGTRLLHVTRALSFNQLRGFHRLRGLGDSELTWQANFSSVTRTEPDTRDITYFVDETGQRRFKNQPASGARLFSELGERSGGGSLDWTVPFERVRLSFGGSAQVSGRSFDARRFRFSVEEGADGAALVTLPPEELFAPEHLGQGVSFEERTLLNDSYEGRLHVFAGYSSVDLRVTERLRLIPGLRYEFATLGVTGRSPYDITTALPLDAERSYRSAVPAANLVYALGPTANLRTAYSYTLARPTFRELAPFLFYDFVRRRAVVGNPELEQTRIHHVDARVEWFPGESEILAASLFGKQFEAPIERVLFSGGEMITFQNADGGRLLGLELESKVSLGRLWGALRHLRAQGNLTLMHSRVTLTGDQGTMTNHVRPMQGQSPYLVNVGLGYANPQQGTELAVLYNVYGPRISEVGVQGNPDVYERPFHRLDVVVSRELGSGLELKLSAQNLLDSPVLLEQGGLASVSYRPGVSVAAQLGWKY